MSKQKSYEDFHLTHKEICVSCWSFSKMSDLLLHQRSWCFSWRICSRISTHHGAAISPPLVLYISSDVSTIKKVKWCPDDVSEMILTYGNHCQASETLRGLPATLLRIMELRVVCGSLFPCSEFEFKDLLKTDRSPGLLAAVEVTEVTVLRMMMMMIFAGAVRWRVCSCLSSYPGPKCQGLMTKGPF